MTYLLPPLNALRAFEAAARHLSFKLAAHELCVTAGAVSQQIRGLEERLGLELFERRNRQVLLTQAGDDYLPAVRDAFRRLASATETLKPPHVVSVLRVGIHPHFDIARLDLARFRKAEPTVVLRILDPAGIDELLHGKLDALIEHGPVRQPGYRCEPLRGRGVRDHLVIPAGTADCPEIIALHRWLAGSNLLLKAS
jgi:DNA-binding transcriptional LysR family regulator